MALISRSFDPERREFVRVRADLPVKYKFLSQDATLVTDEIFQGIQAAAWTRRPGKSLAKARTAA